VSNRWGARSPGAAGELCMSRFTGRRLLDHDLNVMVMVMVMVTNL
jgi:hypothetical protein